MKTPSFRDRNARDVRAYGNALYEQAVGELEEAVHLASMPLPALLINLGGAHLRSGRFENARATLVDGLALDADSPDGRSGEQAIVRLQASRWSARR